MENIAQRIRELARQRNAVILAHFYQIPEIQDIGDYVGDSLELSRRARDTEPDVLVFCGVHFMAESAKILNPTKTVLLPDVTAGCRMADMITPEDVLALRAQHPDAAVVTYVNSTAATKAVSDICCTSSNAVKVVQSLPQKKIIFVPDCNLGAYVARFVPDKEFIYFKGFCPVHHAIRLEMVLSARKDYPNAIVLAHPECRPEVLDNADFIGSTSAIIKYAVTSPNKEFIIITEEGVLHQIRKQAPDKILHILDADILYCPNMKRTTMEDVLASLEKMQYVIELDEEIRLKALKTLERMLAVS